MEVKEEWVSRESAGIRRWGWGVERHVPGERVCVAADKAALGWFGQKLCDRDKSCSCVFCFVSFFPPTRDFMVLTNHAKKVQIHTRKKGHR